MTEVVAALIWKHCKDGADRFMVCRRPANKARGLLWEFVGGKVEAGETKQQALVRECREELDITVAPADIFCMVAHRYPDITINLTLFNCTIASGTPKLLEHVDLQWITPDEIPRYDFCPADTQILQQITERARQKAQPEIKAGVYRHYKGNNYQVIGMAAHSETLEPMVVYRALYGSGGMWVRPAAMWEELVDTPQGKVKRFTYIGEQAGGQS